MKTRHLLLGLFPILAGTVASCLDEDDAAMASKSIDLGNAPKGVELVDLGMVVDGKKVLWANMNVGATKPEEYGDYFAWGETVPHGGVDESNASNYNYAGTYTKTDYWWSSYKYCNGYHDAQTKYVPSIHASSWGYNGFSDNKTVLDPEDDAATANWGGDWRMPTHKEMEALCKLSWTWTTVNGISGYRISGNGHEIFLPAAGCRDFREWKHVCSDGNYWSSSLDESEPHNAWYIFLDSDDFDSCDSVDRSLGFSVRAVMVQD